VAAECRPWVFSRWAWPRLLGQRLLWEGVLALGTAAPRPPPTRRRSPGGGRSRHRPMPTLQHLHMLQPAPHHRRRGSRRRCHLHPRLGHLERTPSTWALGTHNRQRWHQNRCTGRWARLFADQRLHRRLLRLVLVFLVPLASRRRQLDCKVALRHLGHAQPQHACGPTVATSPATAAPRHHQVDRTRHEKIVLRPGSAICAWNVAPSAARWLERCQRRSRGSLRRDFLAAWARPTDGARRPGRMAARPLPARRRSCSSGERWRTFAQKSGR